ncbi:hypothetical protein BH23ACT2_BH23ACT2_01300 [soil metagenome]
MADPLPRGLEPRVTGALDHVPVVVLEGGRAVGKTTLLQRLLARGALNQMVSLAERALLEAARSDPAAFVARLAPPAAVDEAQLAPELLVAVKERADFRDEPGQFLLTGSSRIGTGSGLGGSDPLAGRATRLRLRPFTQGELAGTPRSVVGELFDGDWNGLGRYETVSRSDLARRAIAGGMPTIAWARRERASLTQEYPVGVLTEAMADKRVDRLRLAEHYHSFLLRLPGRLVAASLARDLAIDARTARRELDELVSAFLLERLPAYTGGGRAQARAQSRYVAVDAALAAHAMGVISDSDDSNRFGAVVETFVINELLAQADWTPGFRHHSWRYRDRDEVDLVLTDEQRRAVPIEVKSSHTYRRGHGDGIRAFARQHPGFHRGFVFYGGEDVILDDEVTAVPIGALWQGPPRPGPTTSPGLGSGRGRPGGWTSDDDDDAERIDLFVSYVHRDDELDGGAITRLAADLAGRFEGKTARHIRVVTDKDLRWGDAWADELDRRVSGATFLMAVVTPKFLASTACRKEVMDFRAREGPGRVVLPLLYTAPEAPAADDDVWAYLKAHQWMDWTEHKYDDPGTGAYRRALDGLADQVIERLRADEDTATSLAAASSSTASTTETGDDLGTDLPELIDRLSDDSETILGDWQEALDRLMGALGTGLPAIDLDRRGAAARFRELTESVAPQQEELRVANDGLAEYLHHVGKIIDLITDLGDLDPDLDLDWLHQLAANLSAHHDELKVAGSQLQFMRRVSKALRGPIDEITRSLRIVEDLRQLTAAASKSLRAIDSE